jgi:ribosomal protein S18 acetylase RimI-like enzyme
MDLRWLDESDRAAVMAAGRLFDAPPTPQWTDEFLGRPGHHLAIAYVDGQPAGFVSGVEMTHPDKGTEMFLYELGVDEPYRRQGIGKALVAALAQLARDRGCYGMWCLTDADNQAALGAYGATGAAPHSTPVMLAWQFGPS